VLNGFTPTLAVAYLERNDDATQLLTTTGAPLPSNPKMEAADFSEALIPTYKTRAFI
jgi:hypothetical protein